MLRIFKTKNFSRFANKEGIEDNSLVKVVTALEKGRIDANLGNGLYKQRLARPNQGKSSGYRCIIVYQYNACAYFLYGFPKSEKENLTPDELKEYKKAAGIFLNLSQDKIERMVSEKILTEITF
ncbi:type II toxin-antitoxin system RelE/ParE family toxin [Legionella saoudiensis]|uniref:type II toxin-antitoxin system RelE/ParE family toxin n=1 Tax=Legionella saoudiensis TaxID=1750561 RepID=UPI000731922F|nr:type II toxin-antitoxin system RelE/ParE family toxin [Legionella saoudiensis]